MVRRFLCLGALLLLFLLSVPGCDKAKTSAGPIGSDPDRVAPPKAGGKAG
jgi:hypothetical protein